MTTDGPSSDVSNGDEPDREVPAMGTLVIRTWTEPDRTPGLRARLTYSQSPTSEPKTVYAVDPDEVLGAVREWLLSQSEAPSGA